MASPLKAHVVVGALPFISHFTPMKTLAQHLVALGYQVTFIGGGTFRKAIEDIGATPSVPAGWENFTEESMTAAVQESQKPRPGGGPVPPVNIVASTWFQAQIPTQFEAVQEILKLSQAENPSRPVILLPETSFLVSLPFLLGAPGLQPKGVISVGNIPILTISKDTAPPSSGLVPDSSPEGRIRNEKLNNAYFDSCAPLRPHLNEMLRQLGAKEITQQRQNAVMDLSTIFLQLCPPSLEFSRSDAPPTLRFTGGLPRRESKVSDPSELPDWWSDISNGSKPTKIIAVSQGTITLDFKALIIPTLEALKSVPDILIIAALGKRGASLPTSYIIPENARVADWIPFDALLPLSDVFVTNGGYGSFQNALANGVPLVIAPPFFADKRDIAARVEWSGTGVNLRTGMPSEEELREGVLRVLQEEGFKRRALEVREEIEALDPMRIITGAIDEVAAL